MSETIMCGKPVSYWLELQRRVEAEEPIGGASRLLGEIAALRGKLSFYESRIKELAEFIK